MLRTDKDYDHQRYIRVALHMVDLVSARCHLSKSLVFVSKSLVFVILERHDTYSTHKHRQRKDRERYGDIKWVSFPSGGRSAELTSHLEGFVSLGPQALTGLDMLMDKEMTKRSPGGRRVIDSADAKSTGDAHDVVHLFSISVRYDGGCLVNSKSIGNCGKMSVLRRVGHTLDIHIIA